MDLFKVYSTIRPYENWEVAAYLTFSSKPAWRASAHIYQQAMLNQEIIHIPYLIGAFLCPCG